MFCLAYNFFALPLNRLALSSTADSWYLINCWRRFSHCLKFRVLISYDQWSRRFFKNILWEHPLKGVPTEGFLNIYILVKVEVYILVKVIGWCRTATSLRLCISTGLFLGFCWILEACVSYFSGFKNSYFLGNSPWKVSMSNFETAPFKVCFSC